MTPACAQETTYLPQTIPLYKRNRMKNRLYYVLGVLALAMATFANVDIRQSPPDPTCPFDQWPCTSARK